MGFFSFIVLLGIAYLLWRVSDQMPDLIFRLSEVQRDIAEIRRRLPSEAASEPPGTDAPEPVKPAPPSSAGPTAGGTPESGGL